MALIETAYGSVHELDLRKENSLAEIVVVGHGAELLSEERNQQPFVEQRDENGVRVRRLIPSVARTAIRPDLEV